MPSNRYYVRVCMCVPEGHSTNSLKEAIRLRDAATERGERSDIIDHADFR